MPRLSDDPLATPVVLASSRSQSENITGNWRSLRPVIVAERCTRCLICWKYCPEACVELAGGMPVINYSYCKGCGICVAECPPKCIEFPVEMEAPPVGADMTCAKS